MAVGTSTEQRETKDNKPGAAICPTPTADDLLVKDLPRRQPTGGNDHLNPVDLGRETGASHEHDVQPAPDVPTAVNDPDTAAQPTVADADEPGRGYGQQHPAAVAYLEGSRLRLPDSVDIPAARTVTIGTQTYEIRTESIFRGVFWIKAAGVLVLTLLAAIGVAYLLSGAPGTPIMGVVINAKTGNIIPGASVSVLNGPTVRTNEAGLYVFEDIKPGQYVVAASAIGFEKQNGYVESEPNKIDQLSFALTPLLAETAAASVDSGNAARAGDAKPDAAGKPTATTTKTRSFGAVELQVDFHGYLVFVDGEIYGKNTTKLKRLTAGEHRIILQLEGFEDYATTVTVKARATAKLKIAKADLSPRIDPVRRSRGHFAKGRNYLNDRQWSAAIREFNRALEYDSTYTEALQYRGWAYMKSGHPTKATADLTRAAQLFGDTKRYMDAITCAGYLIEIDPKNPSHWRMRADYRLASTDYDKAVSDYKRAVKLDKKSAENRMALAEAYYASGDYRHAAKQFDRARKLAADPAPAYVRMILSYYYAGENDAVIKKYREFTTVAPEQLLKQLRNDPEWLRVLQVVGSDKRSNN